MDAGWAPLLALGLVDVRLLRHAGFAVFLEQAAVEVLVPQQGPAGALFGFQRRLLFFHLLDEAGDLGGVVGAAEDGHRLDLCSANFTGDGMKRRQQWRIGTAAALLAVVMGLAGCDPQRIDELEEGVSTEADVRARFGEPENIWDVPNGRVLEYNRQPQGQKNYMITIGADGKMSALRQVLTPENFARVQPGMMMEDLRKMLGKP